jgi:hypothetical protein
MFLNTHCGYEICQLSTSDKYVREAEHHLDRLKNTIRGSRPDLAVDQERQVLEPYEFFLRNGLGKKATRIENIA